MPSRELQMALERLGYDLTYVDAGIVEEDQVLREARHAEEAPHEHYRWGAVRRFLDVRTALSERDVEGLLRVADAEARRHDSVAGPILHALLERRDLSDVLFERVVASGSSSSHSHHALRQRLLRGLATEADGAMERALRQGDRVVHQELLSAHELDEERLRWLSENGATRAIRNLAAARIRPRMRRRGERA